MRRFLILLALVGVVGCGGDQPTRSATGPLRSDELAWVHDQVLESRRTYRELDRSYEIREQAGGAPGRRTEYAAALAPVRRCAEKLERLGAAPTMRLEPVERGFRHVCRALARHARASLASFGGSSAEALFVAEGAINEAEQARLLTEGRLARLSLDGKAIASTSRATETSRVDAAFTRAATELVGRPIEVRCWDGRDWPRIVREATAISGGEITIENTGAFVFASDRAHLQLQDCNAVTRLAQSAPAEGEPNAGSSLVTLSHEIQHLVSPFGSEAATECAAMQVLPRLAALIRVPEPLARRLAARYYSYDYPELPDEYVSDECVDGGELDIDAASLDFPS